MTGAVSPGRMVELAAAVALVVAGVLLYRRRAGDGGRYGSQSAVLLFAVAAIVAIHALGGLDYHPSQAEIDGARGR